MGDAYPEFEGALPSSISGLNEIFPESFQEIILRPIFIFQQRRMEISKINFAGQPSDTVVF